MGTLLVGRARARADPRALMRGRAPLTGGDSVNRSPLVRSCVVSFAVALFVALSGCSHVVPSSGPRSPTTPAQVSIYDKEPKKYEQLGSVEVPVGGDVRWDERGDATAGFEKLKTVAAARGANGILLLPTENEKLKVLAGYRGTYYQVPIREGKPNVAVAQAIYVIEK
jgi:hypothetical protein